MATASFGPVDLQGESLPFSGLESEPSIRTAPAHSIRRRCALRLVGFLSSGLPAHQVGLPAHIVPAHSNRPSSLPRFFASRTLREYTEHHYLPAAYRLRAADKGAVARGSSIGKMRRRRDGPRFALARSPWKPRDTSTSSRKPQEVFLKDASSDTIRVELYADGIKGGSAVKYEMTRARQLPDRGGGYAIGPPSPPLVRRGLYSANHGPCDGLATHLEAGWILWQK